MDEWRLDLLAARVVAWHNRHPLARRIAPHHVQSLGYVALPYAGRRPAVAAAEPAGDAAAAVPEPAGDAAAAAPPDAPSADAGTAPPPGRSLREKALARARGGAAPAAAQRAAGPEPVELPPTTVLRAVFSEDFIAPLPPSRVARWARRHGRALRTALAAGPLREVAPDSGRIADGDAIVLLYALTAVVDAGGSRTRLLLGPGPRAAVLGRRLWSRPRVAAAGIAVSALVLAALPLLQGPPVPALPEEEGRHAAVSDAGPAPAPASASAPAGDGPVAESVPVDPGEAIQPATGAASATAAGLPPAEGTAAPEAVVAERPASAGSVSAVVAATAALPSSAGPASAAAQAPTTGARADPPDAAARPVSTPTPPPSMAKEDDAPQDGESRLGSVALPPLLRPLEEARRALALQGRRPLTDDLVSAAAPVRAGSATDGAASAAQGAASAAQAPPPREPARPAGAVAGADSPLAWAVSTRPLRTRGESQQTMAALASLLRDDAASGLRIEMLPAGDDWRVVGWPYGSRAGAERARALLAARGVRVEVVEF